MWVLVAKAAWSQDGAEVDRAEAPGAEVTLEQAIARAHGVPAVEAAEAARAGAEARLDQVRSARLPVLGVSASVSAWDQPQVVEFVPSDAPIDCSTMTDPLLAALCSGLSEPLVVRDQVTASLTARAALPLTGQLAAAHRVRAAEAGLDAAVAEVGAAELDAGHQAEESWLLALQAERQLEIAQAQVKSLQARVRTAEVAFEGGTVTRNDVLKAELALARAEQQVIQVRTVQTAARARLGLAIGTGGRPAVPVAAPSEPPPRPDEPLDGLVERAIGARPELVALRAQVQAADQAARATSADRLPQVGLLGAYVHTEGQGAFALPDAGYVGATLDWTVFAGGARDAGVDAARAVTRQLRAQLEGAEGLVRVEVTARADALGAALDAWQVAARSVAQAEENLRIQDTLRAAGSGTMTDLLDAESALVEARSRTAAALYDAHRAAAALRRALGTEGVDGAAGATTPRGEAVPALGAPDAEPNPARGKE